jgi:hypothetical protein
VLTLAVSLALLPGRAVAQAPDREPIPTADLSLDVGPCPIPFSVSFHVLENNEYTIDFFDDQGIKVRTIIQGRVVLEITNTDTGVSIVRNVSGPGTITYADQLFVGRGSQLFFFFPDELGPGTPGSMFINRGRVVEYLGEPRKIISQTGVQEDLCATLSESPDGDAVGAEASESTDGEAVVGEPAVSEPAVGDESQIPLERLA